MRPLIPDVWGATICYFSDFCALVPAGLATAALRNFTRFCAHLGIPPRCGNPRYAVAGPSWGRKVSPPAATTTGIYRFPPADGEADSWDPPPRRVFSKQRAVSSADLEGLVGEVGFSRPNIFGKFALAHLRPIYKKLYAGKYYAMQLSRESRVLLFWRSIL